MKWFKRFFGPDNSLLLFYDHLTGDTIEDFENQVAEVRKYYELVKLEKIGASLRAGDRQGMAAVVFSHPRKSLFLRALPILRGEEIPFTVLLMPECVGVNRLPPEEEVEVYRSAYPVKMSDGFVANLLESVWNAPEAGEEALRKLRQEVGPLPVPTLDPTRFFATWGKILEIPPSILGVGIHLASSPTQRRHFDDSVRFIEAQTGCRVTSAYATRSLQSHRSLLEGAGIQAVVGFGEGAIDRKTDPMNLPTFRFEKTDEKN